MVVKANSTPMTNGLLIVSPAYENERTSGAPLTSMNGNHDEVVGVMDDAFMLCTISDLARRYGISKQAASKAVKKLLSEKPDTPVERGAQGQVTRVSLAHYDLHRQSHSTPAAAPARKPAEEFDKSTRFEEARRQGEWLRVSREKIRHHEETGQLSRRDPVIQTYINMGREIRSIIHRLQNRADDIAFAVSMSGVDGARTALRKVSEDVVNEIAKCMAPVSTDDVLASHPPSDAG